jgi:hypothetical protein
MKTNPLLLLLLFAFTFAVSSCDKKEEPAPPPVVGKWNLDQVILSGFTGDFQPYNGTYEPSAFRFNYTHTLTADKKFTYRNSDGVTIEQGSGTWEYTGTTLTLNYENGDDETYTYDQAKQQLSQEAIQGTFNLPNPKTDTPEPATGSIQLIYAKQQ